MPGRSSDRLSTPFSVTEVLEFKPSVIPVRNKFVSLSYKDPLIPRIEGLSVDPTKNLY